MRKKKEWRSFIFFVLPGLAGVCVFTLFPFLDVVRRSFFTTVADQFVGWDNYRRVFENQAFLLAVKNTARFTAVCLPILLLSGLLVAILLSGMAKAQFWKSLFLLPMSMPSVTVVMIWKMCFSESGFLNRILELRIDYMGTDRAFWVLVFSYVWKNLGYTVILWLAGIGGVSQDTVEAARVDGAGWLRIWLSVMLPQLKGPFYTIAVLSFLNTFKAFREAYLVAGAYPQESMYLLSHLFNNWFAALDLDKMAAGAVCMAAVLLVFILLFTALCRKGEED